MSVTDVPDSDCTRSPFDNDAMYHRRGFMFFATGLSERVNAMLVKQRRRFYVLLGVIGIAAV